jgi:hypothetical protein
MATDDARASDRRGGSKPIETYETCADGDCAS